MKRLLVLLISFILLLFMGATTALATQNNKIEDSEVQSLLNEVKELCRQEKNLQKQLVLKRKAVQDILKNDKAKDRKYFKDSMEIMNTVNTSIKQAREKENSLWLDLNVAKNNNDLEKMKTDLKAIMNCQKQTIVGMNKKINILNDLISVLNS